MDFTTQVDTAQAIQMIEKYLKLLESTGLKVYIAALTSLIASNLSDPDQIAKVLELVRIVLLVGKQMSKMSFEVSNKVFDLLSGLLNRGFSRRNVSIVDQFDWNSLAKIEWYFLHTKKVFKMLNQHFVSEDVMKKIQSRTTIVILNHLDDMKNLTMCHLSDIIFIFDHFVKLSKKIRIYSSPDNFYGVFEEKRLEVLNMILKAVYVCLGENQLWSFDVRIRFLEVKNLLRQLSNLKSVFEMSRNYDLAYQVELLKSIHLEICRYKFVSRTEMFGYDNAEDAVFVPCDQRDITIDQFWKYLLLLKNKNKDCYPSPDILKLWRTACTSKVWKEVVKDLEMTEEELNPDNVVPETYSCQKSIKLINPSKEELWVAWSI